MTELEALKKIANTLNGIEVKGKDNLDRLLGCILLVNRIIESAEAKEETNAQADPE